GGARSVFAAVQESVNMEWDESLGKLTFVSNLLPESLQAVWSDQSAAEVFAPITGTLVHAWSAQEPYIELGGELTDVRAAADGELMSVAHGMDEELIVRLRHDNGSETLYGNLSECWLEEGAAVYAGDLLGRVIEGKPLCFELRQNGRSVRPVLRPLEEALE
ncbi:MAG: M23 family metallopeptidase, partial [Eubacteriales bacterium]|nr:M23 family metallopeptidase [Eubacteriales bacterium]